METNGIENLLDSFLKELLKNPIDNKNFPAQEGFVKMPHYCLLLKISLNELYELISCLENDKYIHLLQEFSTSDNNTGKILEVSVNLRGKRFMKNGGYVGQQLRTNAEQAGLDKLTAYQIKLSEQLSVATWALAIGTFILVGIELWKLFCHCN